MNYDNPPSNARIVDVQGSQWAFKFTYPNGSQDGQLWVEEGVPVRLNLHSIDVLHALYVPVFRVQRNLVPYRQTVMWFVPVVLSPNEGFPIFCTQYCGEGHSEMLSRVHVLAKAQYDQKMLELSNPFTVTKDGKKTCAVQGCGQNSGRSKWLHQLPHARWPQQHRSDMDGPV